MKKIAVLFFAILILLVSMSASTNAQTGKTWGHVYGYGFYDTRWDNAVLFANGHYGMTLTKGKSLSVFGMGQVTMDTRTEYGQYPLIFNDNYVLGAVGLRYKPYNELWFDVQFGYAFNVQKESFRQSPVTDFRAVAVFGKGKYASSYFIDCFASVGYYSRYENGIGYAIGRIGVVVLPFADVYAFTRLAVDTDKEFFNNIIEPGVGLRFITSRVNGVVFGAEYQKGWYLLDSPYSSPYDAVRFYVTYELNF